MKPIYSTSGEWVALLEGKYLHDTYGEWVGWLDGRDVYTRDGEYAGFLSSDGRILRERVRRGRGVRAAPPAPPKIKIPAKVPLSPMFSELPWKLVDVFEENPELFRHISELRPDWEG
jgi:hypothetical protein